VSWLSPGAFVCGVVSAPVDGPFSLDFPLSEGAGAQPAITIIATPQTTNWKSLNRIMTISHRAKTHHPMKPGKLLTEP
jgi:hypothetical protein